MTEVTIHSHLYRLHENLCFHKQAQLTILTLTCGFHQRASCCCREVLRDVSEVALVRFHQHLYSSLAV